jgi:hypothetical protein
VVVRYRHNRRNKVRRFSVEYFDDVAVAVTICQLEHISAGGQNGPGNLNWLVESDDGLFIPLIGPNVWNEKSSQY